MNSLCLRHSLRLDVRLGHSEIFLWEVLFKIAKQVGLTLVSCVTIRWIVQEFESEGEIHLRARCLRKFDASTVILLVSLILLEESIALVYDLLISSF